VSYRFGGRPRRPVARSNRLTVSGCRGECAARARRACARGAVRGAERAVEDLKRVVDRALERLGAEAQQHRGAALGRQPRERLVGRLAPLCASPARRFGGNSTSAATATRRSSASSGPSRTGTWPHSHGQVSRCRRSRSYQDAVADVEVGEARGRLQEEKLRAGVFVGVLLAMKEIAALSSLQCRRSPQKKMPISCCGFSGSG
jgi:hypothetical protein